MATGRGGVPRRRPPWGRRDQDFLRSGGESRPADAHAIVPALHFQLRNSCFRSQIDQLTDFIDGHQWNSLAYFARRTPRRYQPQTARNSQFAMPRDIIRPYG